MSSNIGLLLILLELRISDAVDQLRLCCLRHVVWCAGTHPFLHPLLHSFGILLEYCERFLRLCWCIEQVAEKIVVHLVVAFSAVDSRAHDTPVLIGIFCVDSRSWIRQNQSQADYRLVVMYS